MQGLYHIFIDLLVYAVIAGSVAWYYYYYLKRSLIGGFWIGMIIGIGGAVIVTYISTIYDWFTTLIIFLMIPKIGGDFYFRVNIIAAIIGAFLFVYILNLINHNKSRE